jgi:hypothetical protein
MLKHEKRPTNAHPKKKEEKGNNKKVSPMFVRLSFRNPYWMRAVLALPALTTIAPLALLTAYRIWWTYLRKRQGHSALAA